MNKCGHGPVTILTARDCPQQEYINNMLYLEKNARTRLKIAVTLKYIILKLEVTPQAGKVPLHRAELGKNTGTLGRKLVNCNLFGIF